MPQLPKQTLLPIVCKRYQAKCLDLWIFFPGKQVLVYKRADSAKIYIQ